LGLADYPAVQDRGDVASLLEKASTAVDMPL
jgi:hypothetical protein